MAGYLDVVPLLIAARPGYESSTHASGAEEDMGECISIGRVVAHLIEILDPGDTDCLRTVVGVVEWILEEGDDEARALLTDGSFDDLTHTDLYDESPNDPRDFAPSLGRVPGSSPPSRCSSDRCRRSAPRPTLGLSRSANGATSLDLAARRPKTQNAATEQRPREGRHRAHIGASRTRGGQPAVLGFDCYGPARA